MKNKLRLLLQSQQTCFIAIFILVVLMFVRQQTLQDAINPDAYAYLRGASLFLTQGFDAFQLHRAQANWPFYSLLIGWVSRCGAVSVWQAAILLNFCFILATAYIFLGCVRCLGGGVRVQWWALLTFVLWHSYTRYWAFVIRDHGYLACYAGSLWALLAFVQRPTWRHAAVWGGLIFVSMLFRVEGMVYFLLLPCFMMGAVRVKALRLYCLPAILLLVSLLVCLGLGISHHLGLGSMVYRLSPTTHHFFDYYHHAVSVLHQQAVYRHAPRYIGIAFMSSLVGMFFAYMLETLGTLNVLGLLAAYCQRRAITWSPGCKSVVKGYAVIGGLIGLCFIAEQFFMTRRYLFSMCFPLMLLVPFAFDALVDQCGLHRWRSVLLAGVVAAALYAAVLSSFFFGHHYVLSKEAGLWLRQNALPSQHLVTNSPVISFYANEPPLYLREHDQVIYSKQSRVLVRQLPPLLAGAADIVALEVSDSEAPVLELWFRQSAPQFTLVTKLPAHQGSRNVLIFHKKLD